MSDRIMKDIIYIKKNIPFFLFFWVYGYVTFFFIFWISGYNKNSFFLKSSSKMMLWFLSEFYIFEYFNSVNNNLF